MSRNIFRKMALSTIMGASIFGMTVFANPVENTDFTIDKSGVVLKSELGAQATDVRELQKGEVIRLGNKVEDSIEVILDYGKLAYVKTDQIVEPKIDKGQEVVNFAVKHVGNPYRYGGNSLTNGTDCSGFTSQVYKNFGVNISRTSGGQYSSNGTHVKKSDLKPGDLVFYGYNGRVNHVAIYMGNNQIVHAGTARTGIHISPLTQRGMAPYMGAKRVI